MNRVIFGLIGLLLVAGCTSNPEPPANGPSALVYDRAALADADNVAILIPGALASVAMFAPAFVWQDRGYALAYYRYPGMDGMPLDHGLTIETAAADIADFANRHPGKRIRLLGYSTGAPIALLAAQDIRAADVKVAMMSPGMPHAGGLPTALRGAYDMVGAAIRAGSLDRAAIAREYYRVLLFGRDAPRATRDEAAASRQIAPKKDRIMVPDNNLASAHWRSLRRWDLPPGFHADPDRIRIYVGLADPVFSTHQTAQFARRIGNPTILGYPGQGHLLFLTSPDVFDDVFDFFEGSAPAR